MTPNTLVAFGDFFMAARARTLANSDARCSATVLKSERGKLHDNFTYGTHA